MMSTVADKMAEFISSNSGTGNDFSVSALILGKTFLFTFTLSTYEI